MITARHVGTLIWVNDMNLDSKLGDPQLIYTFEWERIKNKTKHQDIKKGKRIWIKELIVETKENIKIVMITILKNILNTNFISTKMIQQHVK